MTSQGHDEASFTGHRTIGVPYLGEGIDISAPSESVDEIYASHTTQIDGLTELESMPLVQGLVGVEGMRGEMTCYEVDTERELREAVSETRFEDCGNTEIREAAGEMVADKCAP